MIVEEFKETLLLVCRMFNFICFYGMIYNMFTLEGYIIKWSLLFLISVLCLITIVLYPTWYRAYKRQRREFHKLKAELEKENM